LIIELNTYNKVWDTTYRDRYYRVAMDMYAIRIGLEGICNYGGCPHGEEWDGGTNMKQGCIQLGLSWGMIVGTVTICSHH